MNKNEIIFSGILETDSQKIPVKAIYGSRASLLINFMDRVEFHDGTEFDSLELKISKYSLKLGKCRFFTDSNVPNFKGRLVFIDNVYDFYFIFANKKLSDLNTYFQNLPLIMTQKNKVCESFKKYTIRLTYDLRIYKKYFDGIDFKYKNEPPKVYNSIQNAVIETEGKKFFEFFDNLLEELKKETSSFSKEEHEIHGYYFRRQVWDIILTSEIMSRTNIKPRGYPGDSEMMNMIYQNSYRGDTIFSKLLHKHPIITPAAQAVRNRKRMISKKIEEIKKSFKSMRKQFKILSVACGPVSEIENILKSPDLCRKYHFTFLDQDISALEEAAVNIKKIEERFNRKINYTYIQDSVRTMLRIPKLSKKWGQFHFIYSMGLFDYLTGRVAEVILEKLYSLLLPGGYLLIGNYHEDHPNRIYMEYWLDWVLYYRNEREFLSLLKRSKDAQKEIFFEDTNCQMFLQAKKPK
jgi:extracellular factor (EF) 3-hydroxypalmitic acid methyl ester biosynthesis protein